MDGALIMLWTIHSFSFFFLFLPFLLDFHESQIPITITYPSDVYPSSIAAPRNISSKNFLSDFNSSDFARSSIFRCPRKVSEVD